MAGGYAGVRRPSTQTTFVVLMAASAVLLLLPWDVLRRAREMSQLAAVPQYVASEAARGVAGPLGSLGAPAITAEEHAKLVAQLDALRNENAALTLHASELSAQIGDLTLIRKLGLPAGARLIPAKVIAADAVASRGSLILSKGRLSGVKAGDWIASRRLVDVGADDGASQGAGVLAHESLVGWVEEAEAFTSRVVLLSDPFSRRKTLVHIVRLDAKNTQLLAMLNDKPASFSLEGAGHGLMRIPDIDARWVEQNIVRVGDLVTSDPNDTRLPVAMVIGEITALEKVRDDKKKPLYYTAHVKHRYDPRLLGQVFIADLSRPAK